MSCDNVFCPFCFFLGLCFGSLGFCFVISRTEEEALDSLPESGDLTNLLSEQAKHSCQLQCLEDTMIGLGRGCPCWSGTFHWTPGSDLYARLNLLWAGLLAQWTFIYGAGQTRSVRSLSASGRSVTSTSQGITIQGTINTLNSFFCTRPQGNTRQTALVAVSKSKAEQA